MDRALRTLLTAFLSVAFLYALFLPGEPRARLRDAALASALGLSVFGGGMALSFWIFAQGHLDPATLLAMLVCAATVEVPARYLSFRQSLDLGHARGLTVLFQIFTSFVAAWVAGLPPEVLEAIARAKAASPS